MKNYYIFLLFLTLNFFSYAQVNFEDNTILKNKALIIDGLTNIEIVDLDSDGDLDIITTSFDDDKIAWFENLDGLGNYGSINIIDNLDNPYNARGVDVNGDGYVDVVSGSTASNELIWYKHIDGQGTFEVQNVISNSSSGNGYGIPIDFDNDGDIDFLSKSSTNLVWHENLDGLGNFSTAITIPNTIAGSVVPTDFDNDGDLDLLSRNSSTLSWYENTDGQGGFGPQQILNVFGENASNIYAADFDGDGDNDVLTSTSSEQRIHWYENLDGQGTFGTLQVVSSTIGNCNSIGAADIDGDGDMDILSMTYSAIAWFENLDGLGDFGVQQNLITNLNGPGYVRLGDIDGDNDLDIVSSGGNENTVAWYNNLDGQASYFSTNQINKYIGLDESTIMADMDEDGYLDLVNGNIWYRQKDGQGNFDYDYPKIISDNSFRIYQTYDYDNDNDLDIIGITTSSPRKVVLYENLGLGNNFSYQVLIPELFYYDYNFSFISLTDFDNDGFKDIIYSGAGSETVLHRHIDGQGIFSTGEVLTQDRVQEIVDIDNDGDEDVLFISNDSRTVLWKENIDGSGTLGSDVIIDNDVWDNGECHAYNNTSASASDIDGDGDLDILFYGMSTTDSNMGCQYPTWAYFTVWYENLDGEGNFSDQNVVFFDISAYSGQRAHALAEDMDNDGDIDIFVGDYLMANFYWYENIDGLGDFEFYNISDIGPVETGGYLVGLYSIKPYDINNDGYMDILYHLDTTSGFTTYIDYKQLKWLKNTGDNLSVNDIALDEFTLYPNPTNGILNINSSLEIEKLIVYDLTGKEVLSHANKTSVDVSLLSKGLYLIEIYTKNGVVDTRKFVKK